MGLAQHHDAVSGTEKQHVANDYAQRLSDGIDRAIVVVNDAYAKLLPKEGQTTPIPRQFLCPYSNISACLPIEGQNQVCKILAHDSIQSQLSLQFTLTLWNPTIHPVTIHPHVPVTRQYLIRDPTGNLISAEVYHQQCMTKKKSLLFFLTVSSDSKYNAKCSWSNEFRSESVYISSIVTSTRL
jgi:lysosomal alpha-mannosidase